MGYRQNLNKANFEFRKFLRESWPINWSNFKKPDLIFTAINQSPNTLKALFFSLLAGILISSTFLTVSSYLAFSSVVPADGGELREILLGSKVQLFNPVLETSSEAEKKINSLLYHPLYRIRYPDFLKNPNDNPTIQPILLEKPPEWQNNTDGKNNFRILKFKLKSGLKWSDNSPITVDDVMYSFERIKETGGNQDFNGVFQNYKISPVADSSTEFEIRPIKDDFPANPQLIYQVNFSPISKNFYQSARNNELKTSFRSLQPAVSSGYFTFPTKVTDPDSASNEKIDNPIRKDFEDYSTVVLSKNPLQNTAEKIYLDKYIFKIVADFSDNGGSNRNSLEREAKEKKVDIFSRFLIPQTDINSEKIRQITGLEQKVIPTNTYFNLYLNIQASGGGLDGYFINQTLRNYIICKMVDMNLSDSLAQSVEAIPKDKRSIPIQLGQTYSPDCSKIDQKLVETKNSSGNIIYSIESNERSKIKRVKRFGSELILSFLALNEFRDYGLAVQSRLKDIGLPVQADWTSSSDLASKLKAKNYHFVFLPITYITRDLYPIYGLNAKNVSNIIKNERVKGREIENQLKNYSATDLQDQNSKNQLINFFKNEFVSVNLFRGLQEINYATKVAGLNKIIPDFLTFPLDLYNKIPELYFKTKRKF